MAPWSLPRLVLGRSLEAKSFVLAQARSLRPSECVKWRRVGATNPDPALAEHEDNRGSGHL